MTAARPWDFSYPANGLVGRTPAYPSAVELCNGPPLEGAVARSSTGTDFLLSYLLTQSQNDSLNLLIQLNHWLDIGEVLYVCHDLFAVLLCGSPKMLRGLECE